MTNKMGQNFLFMFEFVVDDVIVVKPNKCAPEEYPTCCEVTFRNSVFVSICHHEYTQCVDPCKPKCGKSCLFSLENPITEDDKLHIQIYKKKTDQCKFLLGFTSLPIKSAFDKVLENFEVQNPNWEDILKRHLKALPHSVEKDNKVVVADDDCDSNDDERREELCPTSEVTKHILPIFNKRKCQTGNVVLIIRLVAIGPAIVSTFPFSRMCNAACEGKRKKCCGGNKTASGHRSRCEAGMDKSRDNSPCGSKQHQTNDGCMTLRDPCDKEVKKTVCQRYFACNVDKSCPFDEIEDEYARAAKRKEEKLKRSCCPSQEPSNSCSCEECLEDCEADPFMCEPCSAETCDDCVADPLSTCGLCEQPCFQTPRRPDPGPNAYDEFEACLNGSGLVIRVLKDTHKVENICDGTEKFNDAGECGNESTQKFDCSIPTLLENSNIARNHIKRQTGGHIINHPNLPKIRANIKYSGKDSYHAEKYHVPFTQVKEYCNYQSSKIDNYRTHRASSRNLNQCESICQPKHRKDEKNCCVQVDSDDIRNFMKDLDMDTRKKGIEVCYKTCDETDSDVFLVKLGSKQKSEHKKNNIEIELKTPKMPVTTTKQHFTTETQINEKELDAALKNVGTMRKPKGKKKKKKAKA